MTAAHSDPGGAKARTLLAWSRTAVTSFSVGAIALRLLPSEHGGRWLVALLAWTIAVAAEAHGYKAYRRDGTIRSRQRAALLLTSANGLLAASVVAMSVS